MNFVSSSKTYCHLHLLQCRYSDLEAVFSNADIVYHKCIVLFSYLIYLMVLTLITLVIEREYFKFVLFIFYLKVINLHVRIDKTNKLLCL